MCLCEHIFSLVHLLSFLSPSLGDGPIYAEILSQRAVKLKTINRPTLLIWIEVGQDLMRLAVGAGVCCLDITIRSPFLWQTTQYKLKYCLKGTKVNPPPLRKKNKTTTKKKKKKKKKTKKKKKKQQKTVSLKIKDEMFLLIIQYT